jgi:hypothetical protein
LASTRTSISFFTVCIGSAGVIARGGSAGSTAPRLVARIVSRLLLRSARSTTDCAGAMITSTDEVNLLPRCTITECRELAVQDGC